MPPSRLFAAAAALLAVAPAALPRGAEPEREPGAVEGRVVVLVLGGADHDTVARLAAEGRLPHLAELAGEDGLLALRPPEPPTAAACWAAFATGREPRETGLPPSWRRELGPDGPRALRGGYVPSTRDLEQLRAGRLLRWTARFAPWPFALGTALVVLAGFLLVFRGLLRLPGRLPAALAGLLALVGLLGARVARGYVPERVSRPDGNALAAAPFWELAAAAGVPVVALDAPLAWEREPPPGARVLAGTGPLDASGGTGEWSLLSTAPEDAGLAAGRTLPLRWQGEHAVGVLPGPRVRLGGPEAEPTTSGTPLALERTSKGGVRALVGDRSHVLSTEAWSPWFELVFDLNPLVKSTGLVRLRLLEFGERARVVASPLHYDVGRAPFWSPLVRPAEFARTVRGSALEPLPAALPPVEGPRPLPSWVDPAARLAELEWNLQRRERALDVLLAEPGGRGLLLAVLDAAEQAERGLRALAEPDHPAHDAALAAREVVFAGRTLRLGAARAAVYEELDALVGRTRARLGPQDALVVCSERGACSARFDVHVNDWLAERGFLRLREGADADDGLAAVDWAHTRAYSLGPGLLFANLRGREAGGSVAPEELPALLDELEGAWRELRHEGRTVVAGVRRARRAGAATGADLELAFAAPFRASWESFAGGFGARPAGAAIAPNRRGPDAGHDSLAADAVRGFAVCDRRLGVPAGGGAVRDLTPTVLGLLGVAAEAGGAGRDLRAEPRR